MFSFYFLFRLLIIIRYGDKFIEDLFLRLSEPESTGISKSQFIEKAKKNLVFIESLGYLTETNDTMLNQQALDTFQSEKCITFGHKYWPLTQNLTIGLRMSITETTFIFEYCEDLCDDDFNETISISLDSFKDTENHWIFHDTARKVFAKIRQMTGISPHSFQVCLFVI